MITPNLVLESNLDINAHTKQKGIEPILYARALEKYLNPKANVFIPYAPTLNANVTSCRQEVSLLNLHAKIFSPNYSNALTKIASSSSRALETCMIIALFATFLTLVILFLYNWGIIGDMVKACDMLPKNFLSKLKRDHPNNIVIGHLNINSIREKFECLKDIIGTSIDMLLISETKLNDTFTQARAN